MTALVYFVIMVAFCVIFTLEVIAPASGAHCDRRWMILAGVLNLVQIGFTLLAGILFRDFFLLHALFPMPDTPTILVGLMSFLSASFIAYWWHRAMHKSDLLWRVFHQLHHSPARIEALTAFYMHPFDGFAATLISSICSFFIFGASYGAAAWALLLAALYNLYIHGDKSSPCWLGYFIARPEMHRVHHKSDYHRSNYGLPLWDLLFGTWENPKEPVVKCGFTPEKAQMIGQMLMTKNVDHIHSWRE